MQVYEHVIGSSQHATRQQRITHVVFPRVAKYASRVTSHEDVAPWI